MKRLIFLLFLVPALCEARIGETLDECIARYGPMEKVDNATGKFFSDYPQHCFNFNHILIRVRLLNGRSAQEEFYSGELDSDYSKVEEIRKANGKKETGIDVIVKHEGYRLTITTKEFDALMKRELGTDKPF